MKKFTIADVLFSEILSKGERRNITGSTGEYCMKDEDCPVGISCIGGVCEGKETICAATKNWQAGLERCFNSGTEADQYAGSGGYWACNTAAVKSFCNSQSR